jgi:hypothetical protein
MSARSLELKNFDFAVLTVAFPIQNTAFMADQSAPLRAPRRYEIGSKNTIHGLGGLFRQSGAKVLTSDA